MARHSYIRWVGLIVVLASIGCGSKQEPVEVFEQENWQGSVDESLPASVQKQQDALIRLFAAFQDVGIENYKWDCPDIQFNETFEKFFGDAISIERWDWAAPPDGNRFQVRLFLKKDDPNASIVEIARTYVVKRQGGRFAVRREE